MNTPVIYNHGPHLYQVFYDGEHIRLKYNLFGANGVTVKPRPGVPNAHGWTTSSNKFNTFEDAQNYFENMVKPKGRNND